MTWPMRAAGSVVVLGVTLWLLPRDAIWTALRSVHLATWSLTLLGFLGGHVVAALKWRMLIAPRGEISVLRALKAHAAGLAANLCLPGVAGGDVVRAAFAMRGAEDKARVAVGSLADRVVDTFAVLFLACLGALFAAVDGEALSALAVVGLALVAGTTAAAGLLLGLRFVPNLPFKALREKLSGVAAEFGRRPSRLALCFALSVAVQSSFVVLTMMIAAQLGAEAPAAAWFFAWPLAKLIAVLPISLAGLGVREAALASLLAPFGAAPTLVVATSLLWQSVLWTAGLLGGLVLLLAPSGARKLEPRSGYDASLGPKERA